MNPTEVERLIVSLVGDGSSFQGMMRDVQKSTTETASHVQSTTRQIEGLTFRLNAFGQTARSTLAAIGVSLSAIGTIRSAVTLAADAEMMQSAFSTMLQSASAGATMVRDIQTLAAETPLDTSTLSAATRQLLQFGIAADQVLPTVRMLGDVAGGDAQRLQSLALAFGQASAAGRLSGQDLLQMINAGFNPLQEMAEHASRTLGGTVTENMATLRAEMEKGHITADIMQESFRRVTSQGGRFSGAMQDAAKTTSGLFSTMVDDINSTLRTIGQDIIEGLQLKELMKQVSAVAQMVTGWLQGISPETKRVVAIIGSLVTGIAALGVAFVAAEVFIAPVVVALSSIAATVLGLLGPIALAGTAAAIFVQKMGGLGPAWESIKSGAATAWDTVRQKTQEFMAWVKPVADALGEMFSAVWDGIKDGAAFMWDRITESFNDAQGGIGAIWASMTDNSKLTWDSVRETALEAIDAVTFSFRNFSAVGELAWTQLKLQAVTFFNVVAHFFTSTIPATLSWFTREWRAIFRDVFVWTGHVFVDLATNVVNVFRNLPGLIAGRTDWTDVWKPLAREFVRTSQELILPERQLGTIERQLQEQVDRQAERIGQMFGDFRTQQQRMRRQARENQDVVEMGWNPLHGIEQWVQFGLDQLKHVASQAGPHGRRIGDELNKGLKDTIRDLDSFLVGGTEDVSRLQAHLDMLTAPIERARGTAATSASGLLNALRPGAIANGVAAAATATTEAVRSLAELVGDSPWIGGAVGGAPAMSLADLMGDSPQIPGMGLVNPYTAGTGVPNVTPFPANWLPPDPNDPSGLPYVPHTNLNLPAIQQAWAQHQATLDALNAPAGRMAPLIPAVSATGEDDSVDLLHEIRDLLKVISGKDPVTLEDAGVA